VIAALWIAAAHASAANEGEGPPNLVGISDKLVTAGQPPAAWLAQLKRNGFDAVIYLAPPTVSDAVRDEATIVGRQGLVFVNVPIDFGAPAERDYEAFAGVMQALGGRRVFVHCQINLRASSLVFLYRAIALKESPESAYDAVSKVWKPDGVWRQFIVAQLRRNGIAFEPY
jgi:protein tyrosine phosphatase (PTP) superfamily phosphohydrolase (DUF442 family)